ncbi:MAG: PTS sugar transporter subunit IIA [Eubacteriaceae bacterium]|nr:PTS sugar transporter subunit IIA [Eubacteriaceae bacterium]MDD4507787.1 PTS sugar transporter subunit IIA [Eubacteriaceae bacterium]
MKKRSVNILQRIVSMRSGTYNLNDLSLRYKVSQRTLQNDIKEINTFIKALGCPQLEMDPQKNIIFDQQLNVTQINQAINALDHYSYTLSAQERQMLTILHLTNTSHYETMEQISERLLVSRVTVKNDFKAIRGTIGHYDLSLQIQSGKGIKLTGSETELRTICIDQFRRLYQDSSSNSRYIFTFLPLAIPMAKIMSTLKAFAQNEKLTFSEHVFFEISLVLLVSLQRISQKHQLSAVESAANSPTDSARHLAAYFNRALSVTFDEPEIGYLSAYLQENHLTPAYGPDDDIELYQIIGTFLMEVGKDLHLELWTDSVLQDALLTHIRTMNDGSLDNAFSDIALSEFPPDFHRIANTVGQHQAILEKYLGYSLTANMRISIALHINSAFLRMHAYFGAINVVIVCPGSIATGKFLEAQIKNYFDFNVLDVIAVSEIQAKLADHSESIDLILSTVNLSNNWIESLTVHPFLAMEDFFMIQKKAYAIKHDKKKPGQITREKIIRTLTHRLSDERITDLKGLYREMNQLIDTHTVTREDGENAITDFLDPGVIKQIDRAPNWQDSLRQAGEMLLCRGAIENRYIGATIQNVLDFGPYIIVSPEVALAHASKKNGVLTNATSLLVTREAVCFEEKKVHFIFFMALKEEEKYLNLVKNVVKIGQSPKIKNALLSCQNPQEIYQILLKEKL